MQLQVSFATRSARRIRLIAAGTSRTYRLSRARQLLCDSRDLSPQQLNSFALEEPLLDVEKAILRRVSLSVSFSDVMYSSTWPTSYLTAGVSAGRCIQASLDAAHKVIADGAILDFPCGFGRVLRFLKEMFPDSTVAGSDIDPEMVDFCRRTFSVQAYLSNPARRFRSLTLPRKFDLIWCGSLITHIDERATTDLLDFFHRHLADGGVCVFTTHGRHVADMFDRREQQFNLSEEGQHKVAHEYQEQGYGYADYPWAFPEDRKGLNGISLSSYARINELAVNVKEVVHYAASWKRIHGERRPRLACGRWRL
jgi:SAM-dependent methyltransferase